MKKWMKASMVTGLSCMIVGAVLYGAGYVFGGKTYVRTADLNHFGTCLLYTSYSIKKYKKGVVF